MRKSSLTLLAAAIGLAAGQASAADLPRKAPAYIPPAPPPITWTGCYIGGNVGGAFGDVSATSPDCRWRSLYKRFWLCRWRSDRLRLSVRRRLGARFPQHVRLDEQR